MTTQMVTLEQYEDMKLRLQKEINELEDDLGELERIIIEMVKEKY